MQQIFRAFIGTAGQVVIPAEVRRTLQLKEGDDLVFEMVGESVRLTKLDTILRDAQAFFREGIPEGVSLVDELLAERREEVRRETVQSDD